MAYRKFCKSKFGKVINYPILHDTESEDEARSACKRIWCKRYNDEPFDILANLAGASANLNSAAAAEVDDPGQVSPEKGIWKQELDELVSIIARQSSFYYQVSDHQGAKLTTIQQTFRSAISGVSQERCIQKHTHFRS